MWASNEIGPSEMAICRACVTPPSAGKVERVAVAVGAGAAIVGAKTTAVGTGVARTGAVGVGATMVTGEEEAEVEEKVKWAPRRKPL